ncbi:unnamed protein product [Caenorhabditis angaria]|uniref:Serpentine receptor class gamma n=1 Tax=Caenorhabditis angaria TaxID=860376 RepID=A0A9P1IGL7_9PELO|nr:unnamed protein product [Caenorhabditis angaria]
MSLLSNLTQDGRIEIECDLSYDNSREILKYIIQFAYLFPGILIHLMILRTIQWKYKKIYRINSFFMIYTVDSMASLSMLIFDAFIGRPIMYIPPLCPIVTPYFFEPSILLKVFYILPNYLRAAKSITQIMMSINRVSCVISPISYISIWKKYLNISIIIILVSPIFVTWNLFLSRVYVIPIFGGFSYNYLKYVKWASLSQFQFLFLSLAILVTIISTIVTLTYLLMLPTRVKSAEKSLCFANFTISAAFTSVAAFQSLFAFFSNFDATLLFSLQFFSYDFLNISSPIVIILINPQLREHIFKGEKANSNVFMRVTVTQTNIN